MQKYSLQWYSVVNMSQNGNNFFFPLINFLPESGKNILFAIGNMTQYWLSKWAKEKTWIVQSLYNAMLGAQL